jgi:hypothetical protein
MVRSTCVGSAPSKCTNPNCGRIASISAQHRRAGANIRESGAVLKRRCTLIARGASAALVAGLLCGVACLPTAVAQPEMNPCFPSCAMPSRWPITGPAQQGLPAGAKRIDPDPHLRQSHACRSEKERISQRQQDKFRQRSCVNKACEDRRRQAQFLR